MLATVKVRQSATTNRHTAGWQTEDCRGNDETWCYMTTANSDITVSQLTVAGETGLISVTLGCLNVQNTLPGVCLLAMKPSRHVRFGLGILEEGAHP